MGVSSALVALCCLLVVLVHVTEVSCRPRRGEGGRKHRNMVLAVEHQERILKEGLCSIPQPRTVCISDLFPSETRLFAPRCTILHVCDGGTGCCADKDEECAGAEMQEVLLPFISIHLDDNGGQKKVAEMLSFVNHTRCECRLKNDFPR